MARLNGLQLHVRVCAHMYVYLLYVCARAKTVAGWEQHARTKVNPARIAQEKLTTPCITRLRVRKQKSR